MQHKIIKSTVCFLVSFSSHFSRIKSKIVDILLLLLVALLSRLQVIFVEIILAGITFRCYYRHKPIISNIQ